MDKIARIDMGAAGGPKVSVGPLGEYAGLGGRAMTSIVIAAEVHPLAHPLGAENKLVISPGMLSGTTGSMTGRLSVGCKSPLTGTIKESNAGGQAAQVLARLGYAAVILEGKPEGSDLYKIYINKDGIQVTVDNSLKLLDNYPLVAKLRQEYGDKVAYMTIGTAGERKLLAASIACTDPELRPTRHCGRGRSVPSSEAWEGRISRKMNFERSSSRRQKQESVGKESGRSCCTQKPTTARWCSFRFLQPDRELIADGY